MHWLTPGQTIVCIDDDFSYACSNGYYYPEQLPKKNWLYTIRAVVPSRLPGTSETQPGLLLVELENKPGPNRKEPAFHPKRFRPTVKTDISIFQQMAASPPLSKEKEPA